MKNRLFTKSLLAMLSTGVLLAGCGGTVQEKGSTQQQAEPPAGQVMAMGPTDCDPNYYCTVSSNYVQCADGYYMSAYWTNEGWCIERDICMRHGGPLVCPF